MNPQLCVVEYDEESNAIRPIAQFEHADPMAQIAANPKDSNLVVTVALPSGKQRHANLWKMDVSHNAIPTDIPSENASLAHLCSLSKHDSVGASRSVAR